MNTELCSRQRVILKVLSIPMIFLGGALTILHFISLFDGVESDVPIVGWAFALGVLIILWRFTWGGIRFLRDPSALNGEAICRFCGMVLFCIFFIFINATFIYFTKIDNIQVHTLFGVGVGVLTFCFPLYRLIKKSLCVSPDKSLD